jgi:hypothetical protein
MKVKLFNYFFDQAPLAGLIWLIALFLFSINFLGFVSNYNWAFDFRNFNKKCIIIDSLSNYNSDGNETSSSWSGYSKNLNNREIEISFGYLSLKQESLLLEKVQKKDTFCVWYHPKSKLVFIAKNKDLSFPKWKFLKAQFLKIIILLITFLNFTYWKQKNKKNNENIK